MCILILLHACRPGLIFTDADVFYPPLQKITGHFWPVDECYSFASAPAGRQVASVYPELVEELEE